MVYSPTFERLGMSTTLFLFFPQVSFQTKTAQFFRLSKCNCRRPGCPAGHGMIPKSKLENPGSTRLPTILLVGNLYQASFSHRSWLGTSKEYQTLVVWLAKPHRDPWDWYGICANILTIKNQPCNMDPTWFSVNKNNSDGRHSACAACCFCPSCKKEVASIWSTDLPIRQVYYHPERGGRFTIPRGGLWFINMGFKITFLEVNLFQ